MAAVETGQRPTVNTRAPRGATGVLVNPVSVGHPVEAPYVNLGRGRETTPTQKLGVGGVGIVAPPGNDINTFRKNLYDGNSGVELLEFDEYPHSDVVAAGRVQNFDPEATLLNLPGGRNFFDPSSTDFYDISTLAALDAVRQAVEPFIVYREREVGGQTLLMPQMDPKIFNPRRVALVGATEGGGTVNEAIKTYLRIMARDEDKIRQSYKEAAERIINRLMASGGSSEDVEAAIEALVDIYDQTKVDKPQDRLELKAEPESVIRGLPDSSLGAIQQSLQIHGEAFYVGAACASSLAAISVARDMLTKPNRKYDAVIVYATEFPNHFVTRSQFEAITALSTIRDPKRTPRPFDMDADGFVFGEAAGAILLLHPDLVRKHGLEVKAWHLASASFGEGYSMTSPLPNGQGTYEIYRELLKARVNGSSVRDLLRQILHYVNAHGTGTGGDGEEATGIRRGEAGLMRTLAGVSSTKGIYGHPLSASAMVEAIAIILMLDDGVMAVNANCENPIPEARRLRLIRGESQRAQIEAGINLSNGFGGHQRGEIYLSAHSTAA